MGSPNNRKVCITSSEAGFEAPMDSQEDKSTSPRRGKSGRRSASTKAEVKNSWLVGRVKLVGAMMATAPVSGSSRSLSARES